MNRATPAKIAPRDKKHLASEIIARLKDARRKADLTQGRLAELIGITTAMMNSYESGVSKVPLVTLIRIADALGISPSTLLPDDVVELREVSTAQSLRLMSAFLQIEPAVRVSLLNLVETMAGSEQARPAEV